MGGHPTHIILENIETFFIYSNGPFSDPNRTLKTGLVLFGIAGLFLSLSGYLFIRVFSFYFDDVGYPEGYPCDHCPASYEAILFNARLLGIIGGIIGASGTWFTIIGYREQTRPISA